MRPDESEPAPSLDPSGWFVMRTPLLPFEELEALAAEGSAPPERSEVCARLRALVARPEVREALYVASPDLSRGIDAWLADPRYDRAERVERSVLRYVQRMASRATPFGLFAGCSLGRLARTTALEVGGRDGYRRVTRLDQGYLRALVAKLTSDARVRDALTYRPNSTLYRTGGELRYFEARALPQNGHAKGADGASPAHPDAPAVQFQLVSAQIDPFLETAIERSLAGARVDEVAGSLAGGDITLEDARGYVEELVVAQVLVPELDVPVTGPSAAGSLVKELWLTKGAEDSAERLERVQALLGALDRGGIANPLASYRAVAEAVAPFGVAADAGALHQVDLFKPSPRATLGPEVVAEVERAVRILHRLARPRRDDALSRFREAFGRRYEMREAPLAEALDDEAGVGFGPSSAPAPLLEGLALGAPTEASLPFGGREVFLLRRLAGALTRGETEIELSEEDLETIETPASERPPLPGAFAFLGALAARSSEAIARGDFRVLATAAVGPSGARFLGRFCHLDADLEQAVREHVRAEEALEPGAVFAEIVHIPSEGRIGNVLGRPVLREHEIAVLARAGTGERGVIPVSDLLVSIRDERVVLRSARLGREVIPRLTSAHNRAHPHSVKLYRFLGALEEQGVASALAWDWGALETAPFCPRVCAGRIVLSRARWNLDRELLERLGGQAAGERARTIADWRAVSRAPRFVGLADGDNELLVDLENPLSVETFVHLLKGRPAAQVVEMLPAPDELPVRGPEGRFVHEICVPFVARAPERPAQGGFRHEASGTGGAVSGPHPEPRDPMPRSPAGSAATVPAEPRSFPPGSEWLYAKLYAGPATADTLLRELVRPLVREARSRHLIDRWFFIRYADPDHHLRLRFHGRADATGLELRPLLESAVAPAIERGRIHRLQLDTYEREVERYGGIRGIVIAERAFEADSDAALAIVSATPGDAHRRARADLAMLGVDRLLSDLGLDLDGKRAFMRAQRDAFARELSLGAPERQRLDAKWQKGGRARAELLLDPKKPPSDRALVLGAEALAQRSSQLERIAGLLESEETEGHLRCSRTELAASLVHMHVNRVLPSEQRRQELVIYDSLNRMYASRVARRAKEAGGGGKPAPAA